jgi:hypothetical protein
MRGGVNPWLCIYDVIKNMNAKEKAKEMMYYYLKELLSAKYSIMGFVINDLAKQCALIAVDEILNHHSQEQGLYRIDTYYWQQVKSELQSL